MNDPEGEDAQFDVQFGPMQSSQLPRNNPSTVNEEEEEVLRVTNPVITNKISEDWKPQKPIMGDVLKIGKDDYTP